MVIDFLLERFQNKSSNTALIWNEEDYSYQWLYDKINEFSIFINANKISQNSIVALRSDFSPLSVAMMLALIQHNCIFVPISFAVKTVDEFLEIAETEFLITIIDDKIELEKLNNKVNHKILLNLKQEKHPGLILFSSGSTGKSKAAVHDFVPLLDKFKVERHTLRTITFLLFDHIGGVNTLLYILSNTGTIVAIKDRSPENVCMLIEKYQVELLPTSPSFIFMLLMSKAYEKYNIHSLKMVTYGTETMPETTLKKMHELFPNIELKQTYGLSELGILRSKSRDNNSLWVKIGGEGFQTKVKEGILFIKAKSAMLGYLNAESPFDDEGWFNTQDRVEVDGDWIKILGRVTEIINVGGQKVYPTEVESVLLEMENVKDVTVYSSPNPILGSVVSAKIVLENVEDLAALKKRIRLYCKDKLEQFKIPVNVIIDNNSQVSARFKKIRKFD
ncbi:fatty acid--CoA ligase family protein [Candidatus Kapaibacterium sp.]